MAKKKVEKENEIALAYDQDKEVLSVRDSVQGLTQQETAIKVQDADTELKAVQLADQVKAYITNLETKRTFFVGPANQYVKGVNAFFKSITGPLEMINSSIRRKMSNYKIELENKRRELERKNAEKVQKALDAGKPMPIVKPVEQHTNVQAGSANLGYRMVWKFQILTPDQMPVQYCSPDEVKIRRAVADGVREIPGVRIYEDAQTNLR